MELPVSLTRNVGRSILITKKNSPHILFAGGVLGSVTSTVLACRATLRLSEILDEIQVNVNEVNSLQNHIAHTAVDRKYTEAQHRQDLAYVYAKAGLKIVKLYAPSAILGAVSIGALTGSHVQMTKRNTALMAAYAIIQKGYEEYRERVREQLGEDRERELYRGEKLEIVKHEDGKNEEVKTVDPNKWSPYAKIFDEYSENWEKDPELNYLFVQCNQNYANVLLRSRGHLFLNEVYDMLGFERSKAGAVVGWVIGKDGDNFVDFGIYEAYNSRFVNGMERSIILDFNVDGVIYDKI